MKIIFSVLFILIGFSYANIEAMEVSPELAATRAKDDTPFIKEYRKRYEALRFIGIEFLFL